MMRLLISVLLFALSLPISAQNIYSGPMLGYNTMREVAVWVQLDSKGYVKIKYWPSEAVDQVKYTTTKYTEDYYANTATIPITMLEPGTTYRYQLIVDDEEDDEATTYEFKTQRLWQWREEPPAFSFLAGSCVYINDPAYDRPGSPYGKKTEIFKKMAKEDADLMIWLGDNAYLREADWNSRSGIYYRNTHTRHDEDLQALLSSMHHYAIWDDHDYGPNDSDRSYAMKDITKEAFQKFWPNLNYGVNGLEGTTGTFTWNDCQFFLLDNRWYRSPQASDGQIIGEEQMEWLIDALQGSKASFKFICIGGQVISDLAKYENHAVFAEERMRLLSNIDKHDIENVVFLTGDRHHSEISKYTYGSGKSVYDITSSPLTSGSYDHSKEPNHYRLEKDAIIGKNNYALISISGPREDRKLEVIFKDINGKKIKKYVLE